MDILEDRTPAREVPFHFTLWEAGPYENFHAVYGTGGKAAIVDPTFRLQEIFAHAEEAGQSIRDVVITHGHGDHIGGIEEAVALGATRIFAPELLVASGRLDAVQDKLIVVKDGTVFEAGGLHHRALHTPGHQPEHMCYVVEKAQLLVSGDTLFIDSCGRTDFPGGDTQAMFESQRRLAALEGDPLVCGGHNYGHVPCEGLGAQKERNPALSTKDWDQFQQLPFLRR